MPLSQLLEKFANKLPFLKQAQDVLVCEADALGLHGTVFTRLGDKVNVAYEAHADAFILQDAVNYLVESLRKQGWAGKHVVLTTPAVTQALLELPIPPKNKLLPSQIAEQIRWDLDLYASQQAGALSIGQLLLAKGQIKPAHIDEILGLQAEANSSKNREIPYKKFGELALEKRYVTQAHLDDVLNRQHWFKAEGDDMHCGWAVQSTTPEAETKSYRWLVTGMNTTLLREWQAVFSALGLNLEAYYPLAGNAFGLVPSGISASNNQAVSVVFELHSHALSAALLQGSNLLQVQHVNGPIVQTLSSMSDFYHAASQTIDQVFLVDAFSRSEAEFNQVLGDVQQVLGRAPTSHSRLGAYAHVGMQAVASDFLNANTQPKLASVPVGEPPMPLTQRPAVRAALAGFIVLSLLGLGEASLLIRQWRTNSEASKVNAELAKVNAAIARIQAKVDAVNKLKESIKDKNEEIKEINASMNLLSVDLPKRNKTLDNLLTELSRVTTEEVVIDRLTEDTITGFSLSGWALNEKAAQEFIKNFQFAMHPLGYRLKDITVTEQTGRLGMLGSAINFKITTLSDEKWRGLKTGASFGALSTPAPTAIASPTGN